MRLVCSTFRQRRSCSTSNFAYSYTFLHVVVCLSEVSLSHSRSLLELFDEFRCHFAGSGTHVKFTDISCYIGVRDPREDMEIGDLGSNPHPRMQLILT